MVGGGWEASFCVLAAGAGGGTFPKGPRYLYSRM